MTWLAQVLADPSGQPSSMRLASLAVVAVVLAGWLYVVIRTQQFVPFGLDNTSLILVALGAKAYQRRGEGPGPTGDKQ